MVVVVLFVVCCWRCCCLLLFVVVCFVGGRWCWWWDQPAHDQPTPTHLPPYVYPFSHHTRFCADAHRSVANTISKTLCCWNAEINNLNKRKRSSLMQLRAWLIRRLSRSSHQLLYKPARYISIIIIENACGVSKKTLGPHSRSGDKLLEIRDIHMISLCTALQVQCWRVNRFFFTGVPLFLVVTRDVVTLSPKLHGSSYHNMGKKMLYVKCTYVDIPEHSVKKHFVF